MRTGSPGEMLDFVVVRAPQARYPQVSPLALPLGPADNIFQLVVGVPALALVAMDAVRRVHRTGKDALPAPQQQCHAEWS